jgi:elongation factor G
LTGLARRSIARLSRSSLGSARIPSRLQIPIGLEDQLKGVVDLVAMKALIWKDESRALSMKSARFRRILKDAAAAAREKLIEAVAASTMS